MNGTAWSKPALAVGDFVVLTGETFAATLRGPFAWRELLDQIWFVARVSIVPTLVLSIPYTVLMAFTLNMVLLEVGAGDLSGSGAALASVTQVGPVVTAIVVSGAGATAMCADLGARTIREEIDAMKVIGVDPTQALVVPRVIAATFVALMLYSVVAVVGLSGSYFFVVFVQNVTPGAFVAGMTLSTGLPQVIVSLVKALLFGLSAGLIACYKGLSVGGGPTAVGNAVNETVAINPALAISGIEILNHWYYNAASLAIMQDCAHALMGVWSGNTLDRTVVVAVYGATG